MGYFICIHVGIHITPLL